MKTAAKKLIASAVAATLIASAGTAFAMGGPQREEGQQGQRLTYIFSQLQLDETQQASVLEVLDALREQHREAMWDQMKELRDREDRPSQEEMQALRDAYQATQSQALTDQLNTVLSPEVTAELVKYLEAHQGPMHGDMGRKQGGKGHMGRGQ